MVRKPLLASFFMILSAVSIMEARVDDEYVPSVDIEQVAINGIRLDSKEDEIVKILGKSENIVEHGADEIVGGEAKTLYYPGLKIYLIGHELFNLECTGATCRTAKGIRVGDPRSKVEMVYGAPSVYEKQGERLGYTFRKDKVYLDCSLVFYFKNNKVIRILYHVDYT